MCVSPATCVEAGGGQDPPPGEAGSWVWSRDAPGAAVSASSCLGELGGLPGREQVEGVRGGLSLARRRRW